MAAELENPSVMLEEMESLLSKFYQACSQVLLLNNVVEQMQTRIDRVKEENLKMNFLYVLRMKRDVMEGIRDLFYEYACDLADRMDQLQDKLLEHDDLDPELELLLEDEE